MNPQINYYKIIQKSFFLTFIAFTLNSCTTTQVANETERDGIYYNPAEDEVYVENEDVEVVKDPLVRLGGKYFNEDNEAPRSFEEEVYENDPVVAVLEPTSNDYINWGDYNGTEISFYNSSPYRTRSRFYPYNNYNLSFAFGFGYGSMFYRPFNPYSYFNPFYGYYNPYSYYNPYYGYYNPYYNTYYNRYHSPIYNYRRPYYGHSSIYTSVKRGKGMNSNVNGNAVNRSSNKRDKNIIRRPNRTSIIAKSNNNNTSIRKRSLNEIKASKNQNRTNYNRNSIRNSRNNNNTVYRRSNTTTSKTNSSNWSRSTPSVKSSTPVRSSSSSTSTSNRRIRR